eukprot:6260171-Prymnesium_polylepis.1
MHHETKTQESPADGALSPMRVVSPLSMVPRVVPTLRTNTHKRSRGTISQTRVAPILQAITWY